MKMTLSKFNTYDSALHQLRVDGFKYFEDYSSKGDLYKLFKKGSKIVALIGSKQDFEYTKYLIRRVNQIISNKPIDPDTELWQSVGESANKPNNF